MAKPTLKDCIQEGLMEIKRLNKLSPIWPQRLCRSIDSYIPFAASFLAGWIRESIKNQTVEIEEK
jgi:hypothetical protein